MCRLARSGHRRFRPLRALRRCYGLGAGAHPSAHGRGRGRRPSFACECPTHHGNTQQQQRVSGNRSGGGRHGAGTGSAGATEAATPPHTACRMRRGNNTAAAATAGRHCPRGHENKPYAPSLLCGPTQAAYVHYQGRCCGNWVLRYHNSVLHSKMQRAPTYRDHSVRRFIGTESTCVCACGNEQLKNSLVGSLDHPRSSTHWISTPRAHAANPFPRNSPRFSDGALVVFALDGRGEGGGG